MVELRVKDTGGRWGMKTVKVDIREYTSYYVVTDHLGSPRVTVHDDGTTVAWQDYYPFGMAMPGRTYNASAPPDQSGFTGYQFEEEGGLDLYHAGARMYDPVIGRFTSQDRFTVKYPSMSPYQYAALNPISFIDVNGDSIWINTKTGFLGLGPVNRTLYLNGVLYNEDGSEYSGEVTGFLSEAKAALDKIGGGEFGAEMLGKLQDSELNFNIKRGDSNSIKGRNDGSNNIDITYNPNSETSGFNMAGNYDRPAFIGLAHELAHGYDFLQGTYDTDVWFQMSNGFEVPRHERTATQYENIVRGEHSVPYRTHYGIDQGKPAGPLQILPQIYILNRIRNR
jgi:RHS repeat-associated protein